jgi:hypothetical protein
MTVRAIEYDGGKGRMSGRCKWFRGTDIDIPPKVASAGLRIFCSLSDSL